MNDSTENALTFLGYTGGLFFGIQVFNWGVTFVGNLF